MTDNTDQIIDEAWEEAIRNPMPENEVEKLLTAVIDRLIEGCRRREDSKSLAQLYENRKKIIEEALKKRKSILKLQ